MNGVFTQTHREAIQERDGKMVKVPREMRIGCLNVKVCLHTNLKTAYDCLGYCSPTDELLLVALEGSPTQRETTLMHELLHLIEFEYNLSNDEGEIILRGSGLAQIIHQLVELDWSDIPVVRSIRPYKNNVEMVELIVPIEVTYDPWRAS